MIAESPLCKSDRGDPVDPVLNSIVSPVPDWEIAEFGISVPD